MQRGEFTVQRCHQSPFAHVPVDQELEETINRDTKVNSGMIGFSLHAGEVHCFMLTAHLLAELAQSCKHMAGMGTDTTLVLKDLRQTQISASNALVQQAFSLGLIPSQFQLCSSVFRQECLRSQGSQ